MARQTRADRNPRSRPTGAISQTLSLLERIRHTARVGIFLAVSACAATAPSGVAAQTTPQEANAFIAKGHQSLRFGAEKERAGDLSEAMLAYEMAKNNASRANTIGAQLRLPFESRPAGLYFLIGQSFLSMAQIRIAQDEQPSEIDDNLFQAERFIRDALYLVNAQHPEGSPEWAARRSEGAFALGSVFFIRGDLPSARNAMLNVLETSPNNSDARTVLNAIDDLERRRLGRPSDRASAIPEPPSEIVSGDWTMKYGVQVGRALFGRWGTVTGMLASDAFEP